jgi:hemoglobin-like flavoprotein
MTPQQKTLVQESFLKALDMPDSVATTFYNRVFELDPEIEPLFRRNIHEQGRMFLQMLGLALNNLGKRNELTSLIQELAQRHVSYGVKDSDYDTIGAALLWTLEQELKEDFTSEVREAWTAAYHLLADAMKSVKAAAA